MKLDSTRPQDDRSLPVRDRAPFDLMAADIDGTLLNSQHEISPAVRQASAALEAAGIPLVLASGREWPALKPYYQQLGLNTPYIGANGGTVVDPARGKVIEHRTLDDVAIETTVKRARQNKLAMFLGDTDAIYAEGDPGFIRPSLEKSDFKLKWCEDVLREGPANVTKITLRGEPQDMERFLKVMAPLEQSMIVTPSGTHTAEVTPIGVSKGAGLKKLAAYMDIPLKRVLVIGDWLNDLSMFAVAGTSVAMGNAEPEVKDAADYVAPSNDEDGMAWAIHGLVLV